MASHSDAAAHGTVRDSINFTRLPWIRPLVDAAAHDYPSVASLFAGNPASPAAWRSTIARVQQQPRAREAVAAMLLAQLTRRGAPPAAIDAATRLAGADTVAVVTGQQAGLFGGPVYTLFKAITAIQLARAASAEHGVPVVPVFWIDADDHDWNEIRPAHVLDREYALATITADDLVGAGRLPVGTLTFDDRITQSIADLEARLAPTEFTADVVATIRAHYRPGVSPATACAGWLDSLLGALGLVVFDASDPDAKRIAAKVFAHEIAHPRETARLARACGERMAASGHSAQIVPGDDVVCLFRVDENGRSAIRCRNGHFTVGDREIAGEALAAEVASHPERFSPNVLLRPLVQDTLFPTVCYVAGPSELAYLGQLRRVYESFNVPMPLVQQRATATIVDSNAMRFLSKHDVQLETLRAQDEAALNELLIAQLPTSVEVAMQVAGDTIEQRMDALAREVPRIDPTLEGATRSTLSRMQDDLKKLHSKIVHAAKRKDETLRRQFHHAREQAFPSGHPQEREIGFVNFLNKYGPGLVDRLFEALPAEMGTHWVITV